MAQVGIGTAPSAQDIEAQRRQDAMSAQADAIAQADSARRDAAEQLRIQGNWDEAVRRRHVEQLKVLFDNARYPESPERRKSLAMFRAQLADARELLWPATMPTS